MAEENKSTGRRRRHSLTDPDDTSLRKIERDVLIPKMIREKSQKEKCVEQVQKFNACTKEYGFSMVFYCRKENDEMKECYKRWFYDKDLIEECTQEYLRLRSEYRRTGLSAEERDMQERLARIYQKRPDLLK